MDPHEAHCRLPPEHLFKLPLQAFLFLMCAAKECKGACDLPQQNLHLLFGPSGVHLTFVGACSK